MKMICPHCGVKGSAEDSLLNRKVKCPRCLGIFIVNSDVVQSLAVEDVELEQVTESIDTPSGESLDDDIIGAADDIFGGDAAADLDKEMDESEIDRLLSGTMEEPAAASDEEVIAALTDYEETGPAGELPPEEDEEDETLTVIEDIPEDAIAEIHEPEGDEDAASGEELALDEPEVAADQEESVLGFEDELVHELEEDQREREETDELTIDEASPESKDDLDIWSEELEEEEVPASPGAAEEDDAKIELEVGEEEPELEEAVSVLDEAEPDEAVSALDEAELEEVASALDDAESDEAASTLDDAEAAVVDEFEEQQEQEEDKQETLEDTVEEDATTEIDEALLDDPESSLLEDDESAQAAEDETPDEDEPEGESIAALEDEEGAEEEAAEALQAEESTEGEDIAGAEPEELVEEDAPGVMEEEEEKQDDIIQKCSACGEYVDQNAKYKLGSNVYCDKCVPRKEKELQDKGEDDASMIRDAVAAASIVPGKFTVSTLIKDAWSYSKGVKGSLWGAIIVMYLLLIGFAAVGILLVEKLMGSADPLNIILTETGIEIVAGVLSYIFTAGLLVIAINKIGGQPYSWKMVFSGFRKFGSLFGLYLLQAIMLIIGFCLLILPGIYLSVGYMLAIPLVMIKGMSPWQALETSRKAIHTRWWTVFFSFIAMTLVLTISIIPLGLALIWTVPMFIVLIGVLYYHFFGDEG